MKKRICITLVLAACLLTANLSAQSVHFGIKGGLGMTTLVPSQGLDSGNSYKDNLGYQAGLAFQIDLPKWFSLEPDILFSVYDSYDDKYDRTQGLASVLVPINVQWGPSFLDDNLRAFIQAGPFLGYAVSKDFKGSITNTTQGTREDFDWDNFNRFQYGWTAGLGFTAFAFQVSAEYFQYLGSITSSTGQANSKINSIFDNNFSGFRVNLAIIF